MKFFFQRNKKKKEANKPNGVNASDLTGQRIASLGDVSSVQYPAVSSSKPQKQRSVQMMKQQPQSFQAPVYGQPIITSEMSPSGKRITTTTVHVPPKQQQYTYQASPLSQPPHSPSPRPPVVLSTPPRSPSSPPHYSTDKTRDLVKKFIADIWNRGEIELIPDVCSPSLRFNGNTGFDRVGHDGLARMVGTIRDALEDYHCEIHSMVVEDNKAFCRLRFTGKHTGHLLGYPPTNKTVAWMGATEFTCQNGKILKVWELGDVRSLEEQINPELRRASQSNR